jgi:AbrB family looped-hinge helix DNA binding protein
MAVLAVAKVSKKYRITLPIEVRDFLNVTEGSNLLFFTIEDTKGRVCIRKS